MYWRGQISLLPGMILAFYLAEQIGVCQAEGVIGRGMADEQLVILGAINELSDELGGGDTTYPSEPIESVSRLPAHANGRRPRHLSIRFRRHNCNSTATFDSAATMSFD